ncbi:GNAT family N-acetyltransferase [Nocardioides jiangxiensis]|uniref:GNAT family N-acetyltransferase n=1 Tax=Nocardioides jiangxiensis TaxID=3064524 RepID=A0ABT9AXE8_9ACTN|nr:GNAT family N-acetyltransferase [Nocardioides sp. WY-20]MDO7867022.1 GNAT family N-acetyltransferase [Nocardioides sp. WY-20]
MTTLLTTERLVLRLMQPGDAPALAAYRSDPEVATLQGWDLPFTLERAERFVAEVGALGWPVLDDWQQVAIELDGAMVGDIGVHRTADGQVATIGYTLARSAQGQGYATEAVGALLALLSSEGVRRVDAATDPENAASARLLLRLGFTLVGRGTSEVRGETVVDDLYVLALDGSRTQG